jgi:hypothetical protein
MDNEFHMLMMGELTIFIGIQEVKQMKQGIFIHQVKYATDLVKKFYMTEAKPVSTPMSMTTVLDPDENGEPVDQRGYRSMIGSLLYLTATRPSIWYSASSSLDIIRFSNADFASCGIDQKNTSNKCHFLGSSLICWYSHKQITVAQSTIEAEYVATTPKFFG